jgi:hypothetical protein
MKSPEAVAGMRIRDRIKNKCGNGGVSAAVAL